MPNKNLRLLLGKPLMAHTIEQALQSGLFEHVVVSTDSRKIAEKAKTYGAETWFLRPLELATDQAPKVPVIRHAFLESENHYGHRFDVIIDLDATSPLRNVEDITKAYRQFLDEDADILITACSARKNPYFNMVEIINGKIQKVKILDKELIKILKKAELKGTKVGVESAVSSVLSSAGRFTIEKDEQFQKIRELEENKIQVSAMFILGFPTDTEDTMLNTINYAKKLNTTYAQFSIWTPYPGTPIFEEYKDKIAAKTYEQYDQYNLIYKHNILNEDKVRHYLEKSYEKFYLRFGWMKKFILSFVG